MKKFLKSLFFVSTFLLSSSAFAMQNTNNSLVVASEDNSMIHSRPYITGMENQTFGTCEILPDGSKFCCEIGKNYTVTCWLHPNGPGLSRCISFNPGGIIGDQSESNPIDNTQIFYEEKELYNSRLHTYFIADEMSNFLNKQINEIVFQSLDEEDFDFIDIDLLLLANGSQFGKTRLINISKRPFILPTLQDMIIRLVKKFNLSRSPRILIYNDEACDPYARVDVMIISGDIEGEEINEIAIPYASLQKYSDYEFAAVLGHELFHIKQFEGYKKAIINIRTGNNTEAEADIASVLANFNSDFAIWLEKFKWNEKYDYFPLPTFSEENVSEVLKTQAVHANVYPSHRARMGLILTMWKHYKRARELLLEE